MNHVLLKVGGFINLQEVLRVSFEFVKYVKKVILDIYVEFIDLSSVSGWYWIN